MGSKRQFPLRAISVSHPQFEVFIDLTGREVFEPLDQTHAVGIEVFAKIESFQLTSRLDPIKINVVDRQPAVVLVYQSKRRASNPGVPADFKALRYTPDETGFASSQLANEGNDFAALQQFTELGAPIHRLAG